MWNTTRFKLQLIIAHIPDVKLRFIIKSYIIRSVRLFSIFYNNSTSVLGIC